MEDALPLDPAADDVPPASTWLERALDGVGVAVVCCDLQGRVLQANAEAARLLGVGAEPLCGLALSRWLPALDAEAWQRLGRAVDPQVLRLGRSTDGGVAPQALELRARPLGEGPQAQVALALVPIDDRLEAEAIERLQHDVLESVALGQSLSEVLNLLCLRFEALAPGAVCSVLRVTPEGTVMPAAGPSLNPVYVEALQGLPIGPKAGSCGTAAWRREPVEVTDLAHDPLWADYVGLLPVLGMAACWSSPVIDAQGEVVATFAVYYRQVGAAPPLHRRMVDACLPLCRIALQHEAGRREIERLAFFDPLTGLPNRRLFGDRARLLLAQAVRDHQPAALLLLDVDRFKTTNDALGHGAGDQLLRAVAQRLERAAGAQAVLARLGGDEFALLRLRCGPIEALHEAGRLQQALAEPLRIAGVPLRVSASVGISLCPNDGDDFALLLKNAEVAMYEAKRGGLGRARFFTPEVDAAIAQQMHLESALREALARSALEVHYQPKFHLDGRGCVGVEALARWNHPVLGRVPPDRFIALAEECGLVADLDAWVLETAITQLAHWQHLGSAVRGVAVNVSSVTFRQDDLPARVRRLLAQHGLPPSALTLEVTERLLLADDDRTRHDLQALQDLGVRLSIDDFGTGYSSLGYLRRLPATEVKLDKTFTQDLEGDAGARELVRAVVAIARALHLEVVAEGVETDGQRRILQACGCDAAQGFVYTPALPAAALSAWLDGPGQAWAGAGAASPRDARAPLA